MKLFHEFWISNLEIKFWMISNLEINLCTRNSRWREIQGANYLFKSDTRKFGD